MKDISKLENGRRKRKQPDDAWLRKYKQLDVSILKNAAKTEKIEDENKKPNNHSINGKPYYTSNSLKKRKPDVNLGISYI